MNYEKQFDIKWADLDPNFHLRNSTFLDFTDQVRFLYFQEHGFPINKWAELGVGPVVMEQNIRFLREVYLDERITVNFKVLSISDDFRIFKIRHEVLKGNGQIAAEVTVTAGFLDLTSRKLAPAPEAMREVIRKAPHV